MKFISNSTAIRRSSRSFTISSKIIPFASRTLMLEKTFYALRKRIHSGFRKVIGTKVIFRQWNRNITTHSPGFRFLIASYLSFIQCYFGWCCCVKKEKEEKKSWNIFSLHVYQLCLETIHHFFKLHVLYYPCARWTIFLLSQGTSF